LGARSRASRPPPRRRAAGAPPLSLDVPHLARPTSDRETGGQGARARAGPATSRRVPTLPHPLFSPQDETNPDFVAEVATLYFSDTAAKLGALVAAFAPGGPPPDLAAVDSAAHQLKGASASFGAASVAAECAAARAAAAAGDADAAGACVGRAAAAFSALRDRMETYAVLETRRKAAETAVAAGG